MCAKCCKLKCLKVGRGLGDGNAGASVRGVRTRGDRDASWGTRGRDIGDAKRHADVVKMKLKSKLFSLVTLFLNEQQLV